jgi:hypothetical protein
MKAILITIAILTVFAVGCSSGNNTQSGPGTTMQGAWTAIGSFTSQKDSIPQSQSGPYQVNLVSSPCSVTTPVGTFSVQGTVCFIANNNALPGSISGPGISSSSTGQGVLIGVPANPVPANAAFSLLFVAGYGNGDFVEFTGSGTVNNGALTGTGSCSPSTPVCQGASGTFSATLQ